MSHFQPDALTISRAGLWHDRRGFTESVLDTGRPIHRLADRFASAVSEEIKLLVDEVQPADLEWDRFHACFGRLSRRIILGDSARDDYEVSQLLAKLMDEANRLPKPGSADHEGLVTQVREYVKKAEQGSLVSLFDKAPSTPNTSVEGQVPHWMFAMHDTLATNVYRALALIVSHPRQRSRVEEEITAARSNGSLTTAAGVGSLNYVAACLQDAMRLYPTTALLSREAVSAAGWDSHIVPAGTLVLISNTFSHRDRKRHDFADRFAPERWVDAGAAADWSFNHFSHGPQNCPGAGLAIFVGQAALAHLLYRRKVRLRRPKLNPERPLPHMLDFFRLRFELESS